MANKNIERLAIANRGEVAVRIIRACQELGIESILLHSEADVNSLAYRLSDAQVCIGPAPISESYLSIPANIQGALSAEADAIHPGFGFLSENAEFAQAVEDNRMIFVGPTAESIRLFGDKVSAKNLVIEAGGPTVPGYQGEDQSLETLLKEVEKIGYPVIVKAAAGGGGRGLKVIHDASQAQSAIESAQREGLSAFGSKRVFLEKYLDHAKHIEVQIFGDSTGKVHHFFERECSVQRRHQKIIEEALSPSLDEEMRNRITQTAVEVAQKAKYRGAGTVEFLLQDGEFYFLEMNTRLQVEHPVTEFVAGVDLVKAQILTAMGRDPRWLGQRSQPHGHAIECRIYAEDPYQNGVPSTGTLGSCHWPSGPGRRFEVGFEKGDEITAYYDSMIAKVIVWDETRARAIQKMKVTLRETIIFGLRTNIPYLLTMLDHPEFIQGTMTTKFVETHFPTGLEPIEMTRSEKAVAERLYTQVQGARSGHKRGPELIENPWAYDWSAR